MFVHFIEQAAESNRPHYNLKKSFQMFMKPFAQSTFTVLALVGFTAIAAPESAEAQVFQMAQNSRAEQICREAASDRGLRVLNIRDVNSHSGGAEVIMEVRQGRSGSQVVGCDYSSATRAVELYEIQDDYSSSGENDWQNQADSESIDNRSDAESVARRAVGNELGIDDPFSSVIRIDKVQRENRSWMVEGRANGAPFEVRLRSDDGSVQDFQLH